MFLERVDRVIQGRVVSICGFMGVVASGSCESTWTESDGGVGSIAVFCWRHREVILDQQIIDRVQETNWSFYRFSSTRGFPLTKARSVVVVLGRSIVSLLLGASP